MARFALLASRSALPSAAASDPPGLSAPDCGFLRMILSAMIATTLGSGLVCGVLLEARKSDEPASAAFAVADIGASVPDQGP